MEERGVPSCLAVAIAKLEFGRGANAKAAQPVIASHMSLDYFPDGEFKTTFKAPLWFIDGKKRYGKEFRYVLRWDSGADEGGKGGGIKELLVHEAKTHAIQNVTPAPILVMPQEGAAAEVSGA